MNTSLRRYSLGSLRPALASLVLGAVTLLLTRPAQAQLFPCEYQTNSDSVSVTVTKYTGNAANVIVPPTITPVGTGTPLLVTGIGPSAFLSNSLVSISFPSTVTNIGSFAFDYCTNLASISIPAGVPSIGTATFNNCTSLSNVVIPASVTNIGDFAFYYCPVLSKVTLPSSVTAVGQYSFAYCYALKSISLPSGLSSIGDGSFYGDFALTSAALPNGLAYLGNYAFDNCSALTNATLAGSITTLQTNVFYGCSNLTSVTIPGTVAAILPSAFADCVGLTNVTFNTGLTSIGTEAFLNCKKLPSVTLPAGLTNLTDYAFSGCTNLAYALFLGDAPPQNTNVFSGDVNRLKYVYYLPGAVGFGSTFDSVVAELYTTLPFNFSYANGGVVINYYTGAGGNVVIPGIINGAPVTAISSNAFANNQIITSLSFSNSIATIGSQAFFNCPNLTSVTLPNGLTNLGQYAFADCPNLTSVVLPNSATNLAKGIFYGDTGLVSASLPANLGHLPDLMFYTNTSLSSITFPTNLVGIGEYTFAFCSSLTNLTFPPSLTTINTFTFDGCTGLTSLTFPASVVSLGNYSFENCSNLTSVYFLGNAPSADIYVFAGNNNIKVYYTPGTTGWSNTFAGLPTIGQIFSYITTNNTVTITGFATAVSDVSIPATIGGLPVTRIAATAFQDNYSIYNLTIPSSVTNIGAYAFYHCGSLTNVNLANGLLSIGANAFNSCLNLSSITLPASVVSLGSETFANSTNLQAINVASGNPVYSSINGVLFQNNGASLQTIPGGQQFFGGSPALLAFPDGLTGSYTIPANVTAVADFAFEGALIGSVTIPNTVTNLGVQAFGSCANLTSITIPASVTGIGLGAFDGPALTYINVAAGNPNFSSVGGVLFNASGNLLIQYPIGLTNSYTIPSNVTGLTNYAFSGGLLTNLVIPASVVNIGSGALSDLGHLSAFNVASGNPSFSSIGGVLFDSTGSFLLQFPLAVSGSYTVPAGTQKIYDDAFYGCAGLTNVTVASSVSSIGTLAFYGCSGLTAITLPAGITNLGAGAFAACGLTSVSLPMGLTSLPSDAFDNCVNLTNVTFSPALVNIGPAAFADTGLYSVAIPYAVTNLGNNAFFNDFNLTNVCFQGNAPASGGQIFNDDNSLTNLFYLVGSHGWGTTFEGLPVSTCTQCGTFYPLLTDFTYPSSGQLVLGSSLVVTGTVAGIQAVSNVYLFVNNGAAVAAKFVASAGTWTIPVTLAPGTNLLSAYAVDMGKHVSPTNTLTVISVVPSTGLIVSPRNGQTNYTGTVVVSGTATNLWGVSAVSVSVNGQTPVPATGTTNWSATVSLTPGTNRFVVNVSDPIGDVTPLSGVGVIYQPAATLTILTNGFGQVTFSPNLLNQPLNIGQSYSITASTPNSGFQFYSWHNLSTGVFTYSPTVTFTMQSNLVLAVNILDVQAPSLTITTPVTPGLLVSNAAYTISGTAMDNVSVSSVTVKLNNGSTQIANGTTSWSQLLTLVPGTNFVQVSAADGSGNVKTQNTFLNYIQTAPITLRTNGLGSITGVANGQSLRIGNYYTVSQGAALGFAFVNWSNSYSGDVSSAPSYTFSMQSNTVITATYHDFQAPTLTIANPPSSGQQVVSNANFVASGTASDNWQVGSVYVSLNHSPSFQLANGTNNWSLPVTLVPGTNTLQAYAVDTTGNVSGTNTAYVDYVVTAPITIYTNGFGTFSPVASGQLLRVGTIYSVTASGLSNLTFVSWTNNLTGAVSNSPTLQFKMTNGLSLTATFKDFVPPTVQVTNVLVPGLSVSNAAFTLAGVANDNWQVASVLVQQNNSGSYLPVDGTTRWSLPVTLTPGTNVFLTYAVDNSGNHSSTNATYVNYIRTAPFTLVTNGLASFTPNNQGQLLRIGTTYTIAATPGSGFRFLNWSNNLTGATSLGLIYSFTMNSNLVVTANLLDTNPPISTITNVASGYPANTVVSNAAFTLGGKAVDNWTVASVYARANQDPFQLATGTTAWSLPVTLQPGTNTVQTFAVDTTGNVSATNTSVLFYASPTQIVVLTNGLGTVTRSFTSTLLNVGQNYTISETPASGFQFAGWSNSVLSAIYTTNLYTFNMQSNLVVTASFADTNPPTVNIVNVPAGLLVSNQVFTVFGTAFDNWAVSAVYVQVNTSGFLLANGTNNWSLPVSLAVGSNTITAYAVDATGNHSPTKIAYVNYVRTAPLTLVSHGLVTITPNLQGQLLRIGTTYTITATPGFGFRFLNWSNNFTGLVGSGLSYSFNMASNLVVTANLLDTNPPTSTITNVAPGSFASTVVSNAAFTLRGSAADNWAVGAVLARANQDAFQLASGTSAWSLPVTLQPGTNSVQTYAVDTTGNVSSTNTYLLFYASPNALTLATNGLGTITPNYTGVKLNVGQNYTVAATPAAGFRFASWSNSVVGTVNITNSYTFNMQSNLLLTATFVDTSAPSVTITTPAASATTVYADYTAKGTASDNWRVGSIYYQLNNSGYQLATGTTNWSAPLVLGLGTNLLQVYAMDNSGNVSTTNSARIVFTSNLGGLWNLSKLQSPAALTFDPVAGLRGGSTFQSASGSMFVTNGLITNATLGGKPFSGTLINLTNGLAQLTVTTSNGTSVLSVAYNNTRDTMMLGESLFGTNDNHQQMILFQRPALTTPTTASVGATWTLSYLSQPSLVSYNPGTGLVGNDTFSTNNGYLSLSAFGTISGLVGGSVTGHFTVASNGLLTATLNTANGGFVANCYLNSALSTMTFVESNATETALGVFTKVPTSNPVLTGNWNILSYQTPAQVNLNGTNLVGGGNFGVNLGSMTVNGTSFAGVLGNAFSGSIRTNLNGLVTITLTNANQQVETQTLYLNSNGNTMTSVAGSTTNNWNQMLLFLRTP